MLPKLIEIKNAKNKWIVVKLLEIKKNNVMVIEYKGHIIQRKIKHVHFEPTYKVAKRQGCVADTSNRKDRRFKTRKNRHRFKKVKSNKFRRKNVNRGQTKSRRRVVWIGNIKVTFL